MLRRRGLHLVRHFWHMQIELPESVGPGPAPDGVAITGVRPPDDLSAVHGIIFEAFADDWDYHPEAFDEWVRGLTKGPSYDPELWRLAREDGRTVGALTGTVLGNRGWVGLLGVLAPERGRGIATALLRHSFAAFAARGVRHVVLAVDAENPTGATAVYERVGMRAVKRWDIWERSAACR
jgi:mycothiol synthase